MPRVLIPLVAGPPAGSLFISPHAASLRDPTPHQVRVAVAGAPPARRRTAPTGRDGRR